MKFVRRSGSRSRKNIVLVPLFKGNQAYEGMITTSCVWEMGEDVCAAPGELAGGEPGREAVKESTMLS